MQADQEADELILLIEELEMKQVLTRGIITSRQADSQSTINLIFMTLFLQKRLIQYQTSKSLDCHSNHKAIQILINLSIIQASLYQSRNWKQTDVKKLRKKLQTYHNISTCLPILGLLAISIKTIDSYVENLIQGIQEVISHTTPFHSITSRSRLGFTKECKKAQQNAKQPKRR